MRRYLTIFYRFYTISHINVNTETKTLPQRDRNGSMKLYTSFSIAWYNVGNACGSIGIDKEIKERYYGIGSVFRPNWHRENSWYCHMGNVFGANRYSDTAMTIAKQNKNGDRRGPN